MPGAANTAKRKAASKPDAQPIGKKGQIRQDRWGWEKEASRTTPTTTMNKKALPKVRWKDDDNLTWTLLSVIEASPAMRQSFGYDTGSRKVLTVHPSGQWTGDEKVYGEVIKNRITTINKKYNMYHNMLSQTGQGLIDGGRDHEIEDGMELANIWDKIRLEFPFYKTLNGLRSTDVSSASGDGVSPPSEADTDQLDQEDDEERTDSHRGSPGLDEEVDAAEPVSLELPDSEEDIPIEATNKSKPANHDRTTKSVPATKMNRMMSTPVPAANTGTAAQPTNKRAALADTTKTILADQRESNECIQFEWECTWLAMKELELVEESKRKAESHV
ncbi:hypothetical protein M422DRAFT_263459 [Sphaerobolus stellatus SS14]|uniref:Uncharacterized protein n=1 Tax=Sphaerobolus stellatus (strain SS14) TaxID=990650 RepID=A0A0C9UYZ2_SPHS4|nr:hypothetical protein M422DRAFT_263459 [Sphaerobolus stellatus SS14]